MQDVIAASYSIHYLGTVSPMPTIRGGGREQLVWTNKINKMNLIFYFRLYNTFHTINNFTVKVRIVTLIGVTNKTVQF